MFNVVVGDSLDLKSITRDAFVTMQPTCPDDGFEVADVRDVVERGQCVEVPVPVLSKALLG